MGGVIVDHSQDHIEATLITTISARQSIKSLWRGAQQLQQASGARSDLPPLWFLTDQARVADPLSIASRMPEGGGVILRDYDHPDRTKLAEALATIAAENGLTFLVGLDPLMASQVGAAGVHLPETALKRAVGIKRNYPDFLVTAAAHNLQALGAAAQIGADAAFLSPIFPTKSHPGAKTLGPVRASRMAQQAAIPVFALGGIDDRTLQRLKGSAFAGIGAIGGLAGQ